MQITRPMVRLMVLIGVGAALVYLLWRVRDGLYPFGIGFLIAYLLNPAVNWLIKKGLKRGAAIAGLYVLLCGAILVLGSLLIPVMIRELESFAKELPQMTAHGEALLQTWQWHYQNATLPNSLRLSLDEGILSLQGQIQLFIASVVASVIALLSHFIGLAISPVLAFYLLYDWPEMGEKLLGLVPASWRQETTLIVKDLDKVLAGVIRGQLTVAAIVGAIVSVALYALGLRYAIIIGVFAGMLDIIPYFGAFIGALPAVTVALLYSPQLAFKVVLLFLVIHQMEGALIGPKIIGDNIGLHPLAVIFFLFIGEEVAGMAGMLLGVPIGAIGKVLLEHAVKALL